jgi:hypothetical protein
MGAVVSWSCVTHPTSVPFLSQHGRRHDRVDGEGAAEREHGRCDRDA